MQTLKRMNSGEKLKLEPPGNVLGWVSSKASSKPRSCVQVVYLGVWSWELMREWEGKSYSSMLLIR